jgi:hypothetical protein
VSLVLSATMERILSWHVLKIDEMAATELFFIIVEESSPEHLVRRTGARPKLPLLGSKIIFIA